MRSPTLTLSLSLVALLLAPLPARAVELTLEGVTGTWKNAIGAPADFYTVGSEAQIRWGIDGGSGQSGLGFTGNQGVPLDAVPGQEIELGTLRHFNNPVYPPTVTSADLSLGLTFRDVEAGAASFVFTFSIDETTNTEPCQYPSTVPCADRIGFPSSFPSVDFAFAGRTLRLQIVGFRSQPGGPITPDFISQEQSTNSAVLVATVRVLSGGCTLPDDHFTKPDSAWPVSSLTLGTVSYTEDQLRAILVGPPPPHAGGIYDLARELVRAKLNRASFAATSDEAENAIANADALIGDQVIPPFGDGSLPRQLTDPVRHALEKYNHGQLGTPTCKPDQVAEEEPPPPPPQACGGNPLLICEDSPCFEDLESQLVHESGAAVYPFQLAQCLGENPAIDPSTATITRIELWANVQQGDETNPSIADKAVADTLQRFSDNGCSAFAITGPTTAGLPFGEIDDVSNHAGVTYTVYFDAPDPSGGVQHLTCSVEVADRADPRCPGKDGKLPKPDPSYDPVPFACAACTGTGCGDCPTAPGVCE